MKTIIKNSIAIAALLLPLLTAAQSLPFEPTPSPENHRIQWYYLQTMDLKKLSYVYADPDNWHMLGASDNPVADNDNYLWCFVGTEDTGFKIYNRGSKKYMESGYFVSANNIDDSDINVVELTSVEGNFFIKYYDQVYKKTRYLIYNSERTDYPFYLASAGWNYYYAEEAFVEQHEQTPTPDASITVSDEHCVITASGEGTVRLYIDDKEVENPCTIARKTRDRTVAVTVTAQEEGKSMSSFSTTFIIPHLDEIDPNYAILIPYDVSTPHNTLDNEGNEGYAKMFDDDNDTKWCVVNNSGAWETIRVDFKSEKPINLLAYSLTPAADTQTFTNRNPRSWTLYGKTTLEEYSEWTVLASETDTVLSTTETAEFSLENIDQSYQYFRFEVSAIAGKDLYTGMHTFQLAELRLVSDTVPHTATPNIRFNLTSKNCVISATGDGEVKLYVDSVLCRNPYIIARTDNDRTITVTATAKEEGKQRSKKTTTFLIPKLEGEIITPTLTPYAVYTPNNDLDNEGDEGYAKMFDNNDNTKWCVVNKSDSWQTIWVDFKSSESFVPVSYILTPASDTWSYYTRNPNAWTLYGKARPDDDWTTLANVANGIDAGMSSKNTTEFELQVIDKAYQHFRFEVSAICGKDRFGSFTFQLAEFRFKGKAATVNGDVNDDGGVAVDDLNIVINVMLGTATVFEWPLADVDDSGGVDINDLNIIINIMLGK